MTGIITESKDGTIACDGVDAVEVYRLAALLSGLKLQKVGIRMSSKIPQATSICRKQYGLKGNIDKMITQVEKLLAEQKNQVNYRKEA